MNNEVKKEARRNYFKYFRVWFIIIAVLAVVYIVLVVGKAISHKEGRGNNEAPTERVYDYADVMTTEEENSLREYIAECEAQYCFDIVVVTTNIDMEALSYSWENAMMNYADDFYDQNNYGFDEVHGDGVLLLDNWYEGQKGSWLSTCGSVYQKFGDYEIDEALYKVDDLIDDSPYRAYKACVTKTCQLMNSEYGFTGVSWFMCLGFSAVVALIYAAVHLTQKPAKDTTNSRTYVVGGKPVMNDKCDNFLRKKVVTRHIDTSSGSGGRSGGGGGHRSSGGVSHGGGGHRR